MLVKCYKVHLKAIILLLIHTKDSKILTRKTVNKNMHKTVSKKLQNFKSNYLVHRQFSRNFSALIVLFLNETKAFIFVK